MRWQELIVRVTANRVPSVEALLGAAGASAVSLRDAADVPVLEPEPGETPLWPDVVVQALFDADADLTALTRLLTDALGDDAGIIVAPVSDESWRDGGREQPAARRIGPRLWLLAADDPPPEDDARAVRLHMGHAFGTGSHPTTALCLEWIEAHLEPGGAVIDYGCGSGVLALAALALGARRAWAVDNDPEALAAARRNAELSAVGERLWIGAPESLPDVRVDVILANILARPLIERAAEFARRLVESGRVVLSGVLSAQREAVLAAYAPHFDVADVVERDGWLMIAAQRRRRLGVHSETQRRTPRPG